MKCAEIWTVHEMGKFTDGVQNIYVSYDSQNKERLFP
jgi:hypothetical protein